MRILEKATACLTLAVTFMLVGLFFFVAAYPYHVAEIPSTNIANQETPVVIEEPHVIEEAVPQETIEEEPVTEEAPSTTVPVPPQTSSVTDPQIELPTRVSDAVTQENVWLIVNEKRVEAGLPILQRNATLDKVALAKAQDMVEHQYFAHADSGGQRIFPHLIEAGYDYWAAGENLALSYTSCAQLMDSWLLSEAHRKNVMDTRYEDFGVAIVKGSWNGYENINFIVTIYGVR